MVQKAAVRLNPLKALIRVKFFFFIVQFTILVITFRLLKGQMPPFIHELLFNNFILYYIVPVKHFWTFVLEKIYINKLNYLITYCVSISIFSL